MGTIPKPKPDAGRGKILSTALLTLALLISLVTFSPFATADNPGGAGNNGNNGGDVCYEDYTEYEWMRWVEDSPAQEEVSHNEWIWTRAVTEYKWGGPIWDPGVIWSEASPGFGWWKMRHLYWPFDPITRTVTETQQAANKPSGAGWQKTGDPIKVVTQEAKPAEGHDEFEWSETSPGEGWSKTGEEQISQREVPCPTEPVCDENHNLTHTFNAANANGYVVHNGDNELCDPVYVHAVNWGFSNSSVGDSIWPQDFRGVNVYEVSQPGEQVSFQVPGELSCGQVDIYWSDNPTPLFGEGAVLNGPQNPPEPHLPKQHGGISTGPTAWHVYGGSEGTTGVITDEDCGEEPQEPVVNIHFQKAVCEIGSIIPGNTPGDPDHRAGRLTWGAVVSKPVGSLAAALDGLENCKAAAGWQFKVAASQDAIAVDASGNAQGGSLVPGSTNANGVLTVSSDDLPGELGAHLLAGNQLWVSEVQQAGFGFENLHCHNDALNADNLDYIKVAANGDLPTDVYCTAWNSSEPDDTETPPSTIPEQPTTTTVPPTTSTTEEVGGIDEEPTTTTEGPTTPEPEVLDTVVTPTTVAKQTLPKTGSNTSTVLSLAGVLMTAGAALVLFGRRRFNAGN